MNLTQQLNSTTSARVSNFVCGSERLKLAASQGSVGVCVIYNSRILVLDDEFLVLLDLMNELQQRGFVNIQTASTAAGAMASVKSGDVNVALLDVNLGGETSYSVASMLQSLNIPFAFVSGYGKEAIE